MPKCTICEHMNMIDSKHPSRGASSDVYRAVVYDLDAKEIEVWLCFQHDLELFKLGQSRFAKKYGFLHKHFVGSDDLEFLEAIFEYAVQIFPELKER